MIVVSKAGQPIRSAERQSLLQDGDGTYEFGRFGDLPGILHAHADAAWPAPVHSTSLTGHPFRFSGRYADSRALQHAL